MHLFQLLCVRFFLLLLGLYVGFVRFHLTFKQLFPFNPFKLIEVVFSLFFILEGVKSLRFVLHAFQRLLIFHVNFVPGDLVYQILYSLLL